MKASDLTPNVKNPRKISPAKLKMLKASLKEFGDLSGIVFNRQSGQLIGGHQRSALIPKDAEITVTNKYKKPTTTGTVAEGYIQVGSERFAYREVSFDEQREKAANIAANRGAGEWDLDALKNWFTELDDGLFDLDLTMFDADERDKMMGVKVEPSGEGGETYKSMFEVVVECASEEEQQATFEKLTKRDGLKCRVLSM